jgi:type IV pilus assembly protein PilY1
MNNYCSTPPFIVGGVYPNLLLMIDNSASMYDLSWINPNTYCYDETYSNANTYIGYFKLQTNAGGTQYYEYNSTDVLNQNNPGIFATSSMPASCNYGGLSSTTPYVCINVISTGFTNPPYKVSQFVASGNFLNWLSASKFDVEKQILTGGKFDAASNTLLGESRGCVGRRFVKVVPALNSVTVGGITGIAFAARGPNSYEADYANGSTQGGQSRIDIYMGTYNAAACLRAVNDWETGAPLGTSQTDTKECLGVQGNAVTSTSVYNHIIHNCYWFYSGHPMTNDQPLQNECAALYANYGSCECTNGSTTPSPACCITNDNAADAICSSALSHPNFNGNSTGYVGKCYTPSTGVWDDNCVITEMTDFCEGIGKSPVTDPSSGSAIQGTELNVPGFVMDAGLTALGAASGTFFVKVGVSSPPTGLINQFASQIRFGAMTFNFDGSSSECNVAGSNITCPKKCSITTSKQCYFDSDCPEIALGVHEPCIAAATRDAANIISYIGYDAVGDHSSGLINAIDNIEASSWTPFAEGLYNAIGYFARTNDYTSSPGTSRTDVRINTADFDANKNPSQYRCQQNNVLLITDGMSTADKNASSESLASLYNYDGIYGYDSVNGCPTYAGSRDVDAIAWLGKNVNIKTFSTSSKSTDAPANGSEYMRTYVVYSGPSRSVEPGKCDPFTLMNATATAGGTSLYAASNPSEMETAIRNALQLIAVKSASGTAASVLASGEGSGANLIQAVFYPTRKFDNPTNQDVLWTGIMQNLWYYIDPNLGSSTIRDDYSGGNPDKELKLTGDNIINFRFNSTTNETEVQLFADSNGDGSPDSATPWATVPFDGVSNLWEAGNLLWSRTAGNLNSDAGARQIFTNTRVRGTCSTAGTNCSATSDCPVNESCIVTDHALDKFDTSNAAALQPFVNVNVSVAEDGTYEQTQRLIRYVRGIDITDPIDNQPVRARAATIGGTTNIWKLGDIVSSTPKVESWLALNTYDKAYNDGQYVSYINSSDYKKRNMVFTGANDGMFHAFKMGLLGLFNESDRKATIGWRCSNNETKACYPGGSQCVSPGTCQLPSDVGQEKWAFIPKNALPYLKYLAEKDYCHLFFVDQTPFIFDASIGVLNDGVPADCTEAEYWKCPKQTKCKDAVDSSLNKECSAVNVELDLTNTSWRTIVIGGMRLGGACRNKNASCTECSTTPVDGIGYSSYFALDVTNPDSPTLLWEFANPALGFSTSGPAVVRVGNGNPLLGASNDPNQDVHNGRWFAVFGSGPSGYLSTGTHQFLGITEHQGAGNLKLFVVDLRTGRLVRTIDTGRDAAFSGSIVNAPMDYDLDYQDDALYFGFTSRAFDEAASPTGTAQNGSDNTITLAASSSSLNNDPAIKGRFIHLSSTHETKLITDYAGATKVATVDSNWKLTRPANGTEYSIFPGWTNGGVMRVVTKQSADPADWVPSTFIGNIGPVTASVVKLVNYTDKVARFYFGTGRYFYRANDIIDDASTPRRIYGIKEPCIATTTDPMPKIDDTCTTTVLESDLTSATSGGITDDLTVKGWYIDLDGCTDVNGAAVSCTSSTAVYRAERVTANPVAATSGAIFFTTTSPTADICGYGGSSHLWATRFDTGGSLLNTGILKGKALIQVSTGSIQELPLDETFKQHTDPTDPLYNPDPKGGRRSGTLQGMTSSEGFSLVVPPKPIKRVMHIQKK